MDKVHDQASTVRTEPQVVLVDGPGGISVALTPRAAAETADLLKVGAAEAQEPPRVDDEVR